MTQQQQLYARGDVVATAPMVEAMKRLRALGGDQALVQMKLHRGTVRALQRRDWIVESRKVGGYMLTGRGLKALDVLLKPIPRRKDGICPRCGERPRGDNSYCPPCNVEYVRRLRALGLARPYRADRPCQCGQPRYVSPSGYVAMRCLACLRAEVQRTRAQRTQAILSGARPLPMCKCGRGPHKATATRVYSYCAACLREMNRQMYEKRKARQLAARMEAMR